MKARGRSPSKARRKEISSKTRNAIQEEIKRETKRIVDSIDMQSLMEEAKKIVSTKRPLSEGEKTSQLAYYEAVLSNEIISRLKIPNSTKGKLGKLVNLWLIAGKIRLDTARGQPVSVSSLAKLLKEVRQIQKSLPQRGRVENTKKEIKSLDTAIRELEDTQKESLSLSKGGSVSGTLEFYADLLEVQMHRLMGPIEYQKYIGATKALKNKLAE